MARDRVRRPFRALAAAACIAGLALLAGLWLSQRQPVNPTLFTAYRTEMAAFLRQFPRLDVELERLPDIRQWLITRHGLNQVEIPAGLGRFPGIGCRTVQWRGKELALICFMVDGEAVHLFVMRRSEFSDYRFETTPQLARIESMTTAAWGDSAHVFLALTKGDESLLKKHL